MLSKHTCDLAAIVTTTHHTVLYTVLYTLPSEFNVTQKTLSKPSLCKLPVRGNKRIINLWCGEPVTIQAPSGD